MLPDTMKLIDTWIFTWVNISCGCQNINYFSYLHFQIENVPVIVKTDSCWLFSFRFFCAIHSWPSFHMESFLLGNWKYIFLNILLLRTCCCLAVSTWLSSLLCVCALSRINWSKNGEMWNWHGFVYQVVWPGSHVTPSFFFSDWHFQFLHVPKSD